MITLTKSRLNKKLLLAQLIFLILAFVLIFIFYPKAELDVNGSFVRFNSINSNVIVISDNPEFLNPRYIDFKDANNFSVKLNPGKYYYKSYNNLLESFDNEFEIDSVVGLDLDEYEKDRELINVGNVKINVTKNSKGELIGNIELVPDETKKEDKIGDEYVARQI